MGAWKQKVIKEWDAREAIDNATKEFVQIWNHFHTDLVKRLDDPVALDAALEHAKEQHKRHYDLDDHVETLFLQSVLGTLRYRKDLWTVEEIENAEAAERV